MKFLLPLVFLSLGLSAQAQFVRANSATKLIVSPPGFWESNKLAILDALDISATNYNQFYFDLTNALVAGGGISLTPSPGKLTIAAAGSTNSGTVLSVDGSLQVSVNLADGSEITGTLVGTNWTYAVAANSLGTNKLTTAAWLATINRTNHYGNQNWSTIIGTPTTASGYGLTDVEPLNAGKYQATNSVLTTLVTLNGAALTNLNGSSIASGTVAAARIDSAMATDVELATKQAGSSVLTNVAALTSGTATNFLAGDGTFKQVTTNMIPGLNALIAAGGGGGGTNYTQFYYDLTNALRAGANVTLTPGAGILTISASGSGGGGDVYTSSNNIFTASNSFPYLDIGTLTVTTNLLVADDAYASGWNGSSNVPTKNAVYDKIESLAVGGTELQINGVSSISNLVDSEQIVFVKTNGTGAGRLASNLVFTSISAPSLVVTGSVSLATPTFTGVVTSTNLAATYVAKTGDTMTGALSNTVSVGSPILYVGTTNVAAALAAGGGGSWDGTPIASGTITNLTTSSLNLRPYYNPENGDIWQDNHNREGVTTAFKPFLTGSAVASGSISAAPITTNIQMSVTFSSHATTTNSGYAYHAGHGSTKDIGIGGQIITTIAAISNTNKVQAAWGFIDSFTEAESADGAYFRMDNGYVHGVIANNSSYTRTVTSNRLAIAATTFKRYVVQTSDDATYVTFSILSPSGSGYTTDWTESITNALPTGSSRLTSIGIVAVNRDTPSAINLISLNAVGLRNTKTMIR